MSDISKEIKELAPNSGFTADEYNFVARGGNLEAVVLTSSQFNFSLEALSKRKEWKLKHGRTIKVSQYSAESNSVAVVIEYHVAAKLGRKTALRCIAEYAVFYETPEEACEAAAIGFARNVGIFAAYPYFRGLVARLMAEANVSLPPLPTIASTAHIPPKKMQAEIEVGA